MRGTVATNAKLPFDARVIGFKLGIIDWPVGKRRSVGHAIAACQPKIIGVEPPRHALIDARSAADRHRIVEPAGSVRIVDPMFATPGIQIEARASLLTVGACVVAMQRQPVIAQMIARDIAICQVRAAIYDEHACACLCQDACCRPATRTRADDQHVHRLGYRGERCVRGAAMSDRIDAD